MKNYKEFEKRWIGCSDAAFLTFTGCGNDGVKAEIVKFGGDSDYYAYIVEGENVEIGSHYRLVATFNTWVKIFDDSNGTFSHHAYGSIINIYRAGEYGCIIQIISSKAQK